VGYLTRVGVDIVRKLTRPTEQVRRPIGLEDYGPRVVRLPPEGETAGVRAGDRVVAVAGRPLTGSAVLARALAVARPGDTVSLTLEREGAEIVVPVTLAASRSAPPGLGEVALTVTLGLAMPVVCVLVGFSVAALRPRDLRAWLLLGLMLGFLHFSRDADPFAWGDAIRVPGIALFGTFFTSWFVFMLLFGLYFPERFAFERRRSWLKWILLVPLIGFGLAQVAVEVGRSESFALTAALHRALEPYQGLKLALQMTAVGLFFASLGAKTGMTPDRDARRRLLLLNVGTQLSMAPIFVLILVSLVRTGTADLGLFPPWIYLPAMAAALLFPLTMAYVVVAHRALDIRVVIRQGVQYALAQGGVRVVQVAASAAVLFYAFSLAADPSTNRPQKITAMARGIGVVFLLQFFAARLAKWIDRRFFREAYDAETILSDLAEEVRTMVETGPLLQRVTERICASLHVPRAVVLLHAGGSYRPALAVGYGGAPEVAFPEDAGIVQRMKEEKAPTRVYLEDPEAWVNRHPAVTDTERADLGALHTQLLLPFTARDSLLGFMSLGPKQSEEPFSGTDVRVLRSVASQTGMALENSRLTEAIAKEVAQRERNRRELEIAREVQEQLFPQTHPAVTNLDYAGHCRPALGVGGDYYDFLALPGGLFGLAIGDVAGKGISAALLMASLQASLRGQTLNGTADLASLMGNVNRLICDASLANRYATFFYSQYDPISRDLVYVNAGHNAPMVFRDQDLLRLDQGGAVVGMLPTFPYEQATIRLRPGDLLVAFTDGISEAMDTADEEWGEERLVEAVRQRPDLSAEPLLRHLLAAADAFAVGAKQHDDMTLVVARVR